MNIVKIQINNGETLSKWYDLDKRSIKEYCYRLFDAVYNNIIDIDERYQQRHRIRCLTVSVLEYNKEWQEYRETNRYSYFEDVEHDTAIMKQGTLRNLLHFEESIDNDTFFWVW